MQINYSDIDWKASRVAMKKGGLKLSKLVEDLGVNYRSLNVLLSGRHMLVNPEASSLVRTAAAGLSARGFLVFKTQRTGTEG